MQETWVQSLGGEDPLEKGMATHSSYSYLENPMDRGAWWATVHRVPESQTQMKGLSTHVSDSFGAKSLDCHTFSKIIHWVWSIPPLNNSLIWPFSPLGISLGPHLSLAGFLTTMLSSQWAMVVSCKISALHCQSSPIICQILDPQPLLAWSFFSPWHELSLCYLWDSRVLICDFSVDGILCSWCLFLYYPFFQPDHMLLKDRNAFFSLCPSEFIIPCVIYYKPGISGVE